MTNMFKSGEIICLENDHQRLFTEVIEMVYSRQIAWVRPVILVINSDDQDQVIDLRESADLLWSIDDFRPAFDTEVIPFLVELQDKIPDGKNAQQYLSVFVRKLCQIRKKRQ
jgi:hypothetical protein